MQSAFVSFRLLVFVESLLRKEMNRSESAAPLLLSASIRSLQVAKSVSVWHRTETEDDDDGDSDDDLCCCKQGNNFCPLFTKHSTVFPQVSTSFQSPPASVSAVTQPQSLRLTDGQFLSHVLLFGSL